jgi:hypothetical protein
VLRRLLAAVLAAGAVLVVVGVLRPPAPATTRVVVAARAVPAGTTLRPDDVRTTHEPVAAAPPGALTAADEALGRVVATGLLAGEPLSVTRLVPHRPDEPGTVAAHLLVADERSLDLTPPGSHVTLYPATGGAAVASAALVLTVDPPAGGEAGVTGPLAGAASAPGGAGTFPRGVVVALHPEAARAVFSAVRPEGGAPVVLVVPAPEP